jgi:stage II sporulation protein D
MRKKFKKIFVYILFLVILIKCFEIVFLKKTVPTVNETKEITEFKDWNYGDYTTIKLLHTDTNEVEELQIDKYLYGVVSAEMPVSFELEALKAQATVARTYTIYKLKNGSKHEEADICDSSLCCQAWISKENRFARWAEDEREENWLKIEEAVNSTIGKVILYNGEPINAFFHSNSGGSTESSVNVWGGDYPYLQIVQTVGEESYSSYESEVILSKDDLIQKMHDSYEDFKINFDDENCIQILENTESGRVKTLKIGNIELTGVQARTIFGLKSAKFTVSIENDNIKFKVLGYGHGVGLSQCGSDSLAKKR